ncbi:MAG: hypothetical protein A2X52_22360 [Candidatus Rokubacteria bacterium GWC2_70_16]|nr:MAG: hypothetical protein A2X52_22360 [Candidatus Rokubacteria bacterium GWC2_70_16]
MSRRIIYITPGRAVNRPDLSALRAPRELYHGGMFRLGASRQGRAITMGGQDTAPMTRVDYRHPGGQRRECA